MTGKSYSTPICFSKPAAIELSAGFTEDARTRTSTSFAAGVGAGRSSRRTGAVSESFSVTAFNCSVPFVCQLLMAGCGFKTVPRRPTQNSIGTSTIVAVIVSDVPSRTTTQRAARTHDLIEERATSEGLLLALLGQQAMRRLRAAPAEHKLSPRQLHHLGRLHDRGALTQRVPGAPLPGHAS